MPRRKARVAALFLGAALTCTGLAGCSTHTGATKGANQATPSIGTGTTAAGTTQGNAGRAGPGTNRTGGSHPTDGETITGSITTH